jgi:hypothetical protein
MLMLATVGKEYNQLWDSFWMHEDYRIPPASIPLLLLGSVVGTGIGYSGWWCRTVVSATSFTLIGGAFLLAFVVVSFYYYRVVTTLCHLRMILILFVVL